MIHEHGWRAHARERHDLAYLAAVIALVIAPGPGQALVLARTLSGGRRAGFATSLGLEVGTLTHTLAAALGLSGLLASSANAFAVVKYAGAAYLVYLGVQAWRRADAAPDAAEGSPALLAADGFGRLVLRGAVTGVLNPKVALFFLAFLPQFVRPEAGHVLLQFIGLGPHARGGGAGRRHGGRLGGALGPRASTPKPSVCPLARALHRKRADAARHPLGVRAPPRLTG